MYVYACVYIHKYIYVYVSLFVGAHIGRDKIDAAKGQVTSDWADRCVFKSFAKAELLNDPKPQFLNP